MVLKTTAVAQYKRHSLNENGSVSLNLKFKYDQLVNVIQLMQMFSNDVQVTVKIPGVSVYKLGMFRIKSITVDGDGESVVKLNGLNDYVEVNHLNDIVTKDLFQVRFVTTVEEEDNNE